MSGFTQGSLMRFIWEANKHSGRNKNHKRPWLIENYTWIPNPRDRDPYSNQPRVQEVKIEFSEHRRRAIPKWEMRQRFRQSVEFLYWEAERARALANSYRGFNVGIGMLGFKPGMPHSTSWQAYMGMNTKVHRNARPVCAEPIAISSAQADGCTYVIGMVIVGDLREEDVGVIDTLHPCTECLMFMDSNITMRPDTLVITAKPPVDGKPGPYEVWTFKRLYEFHRGLNPELFHQH
jgi:cytidine deaminase